MGERRKRKSLWDHEEEARCLSGICEHHSWTGKDRHSGHDSGRYHEFSESRTTIMQKSRDHSGYQSWESIEEDPVPLMNGNFNSTHNENDIVGGKRFYEEMSPGYDSMEMHDYIRTRDYDRSHLQRYPGRGRSRSRSRSRTKGRSPSRSYSRGRGREGAKGFSRSRSRSRSFDNARAYSRSRSPMVDYRRQSYEWSGRRNSSEKPSQICREFASRSCRRGSQCRFFHPISMSRRDGDLMEHDIHEEWRSRADLSLIRKHSYRRGSGYESRNDISDPYYREDEQFPKKNRNAIPCKDFAKGNCRWGDTCRFSHTAASDGSFGQGTRNVSYDKYVEREQYKNGKPLCKFFAAGKCDRKNCRFSHEDPNFNDCNVLPGEVTASGSSRETSKCWNGRTWDDEARPTGNRKSTVWGESTVTNAAGAGKGSGGPNDDREGQSGTSRYWNGPTWDDEARPVGTRKSSGWSGTAVTNAASAGNSSGEHNDNREGRSEANKCWNGSTWGDEARPSDAQKFTGWGASTVTNAVGEINFSGQNDKREGQSDTNKCLNAPTWDDEARPLDTHKSIGCGESTVTNAVHAGNAIGGPNDNREGWVNGSKCWNVPTWDDEARSLDTQKSTGWGVSTAANSAGTKNARSEQNDNKEGWSLESKEKNLERLEHTSSPLNREQQLSLAEKRSNYGRDSGSTEYVAIGNRAAKPESHTLHSSWLQNQAGIGEVGHNALQENKNVHIEPLHQNLFPASHIQTNFHRTEENRVLNSSGSDNSGLVKETRYPSNPLLFPGKSLNLNSDSMVAGYSSISNQGDGLQNTLGPPLSNGFSVDLNVPETHIVDHLNMQSQTQNNQKPVHSPGLLGTKIPQSLTDILTSEQSAQLLTSLVSTAQQFSPVKNPVPLPQRHEHSQTNTGTEVLSSRRMVPPFSDTLRGADLVNATSAQGNPGSISLNLFSSMGNGKGNSEHGDAQHGTHSMTQATVPIVEVEHSRPLSVSCMEFNDSKEKHPKSPTSRQEVVVTKSEVAEANKVVEQTIKGTQENKQTGMLDGHVKVEEGNSNKDEKGVRIFKNSLVEFVKEILKPKWKEGRMSRDAHKAVVKKVVDKISSSIPADHIPRTQDKVDLYLSHSKPKITKLVQAYVDRCPKGES